MERYCVDSLICCLNMIRYYPVSAQIIKPLNLFLSHSFFLLKKNIIIGEWDMHEES